MRAHAAWFLVIAVLPGCGGTESAPPSHNARLGPHAGPIVELPGGRGVAEVVVEAAPGKKAGLEARVTAYFLRPDLKSPLADKPADVVVKLQLPGDERVDLPLAPEPDPKDPTAARYVSKFGPYSTDQVIGELTGNVGGEPFALPFATAR